MTDTANVTSKAPANGRGETTRGGYAFTPRVDIFETDTELLLYAEVPGVRAEDVDLHFEKGELTLHAKVNVPENRPAGWLREYEVGDFYRVLSINESIDTKRIEAECKNGVLTLHLPKVEAVRPRQIAVKA